ncbi:MAG: glycerophosphoryl diester phosphodiesterase [Nitrospira sp.]|nr:glycerophosphoryl diester phosphodiesterase [Nitrospira sp.]MBH0195198.1 glycerophosphoryl diester phosphodiesterase [Nitrospira sp.]
MHRVLRIGHRGAAGHAPENTLAAIQKGIELGVDFVEIDLRRTADNVLVVLHDASVNRTTNGRGRIDRLSLNEVKKLDAGNGERIPTFAEVLTAVSSRCGLMLEIKVKGIARQVVEMVQALRFRGPAIYASFLHDELREVRAADRKAPLMVLFSRLPRVPVSFATKYKATHVGLRHDTATGRLINAFHHAGLFVCVYTANHPGDIQHALSVGVDGVISNVPDRIIVA